MAMVVTKDGAIVLCYTKYRDEKLGKFFASVSKNHKGGGNL